MDSIPRSNTEHWITAGVEALSDILSTWVLGAFQMNHAGGAETGCGKKCAYRRNAFIKIMFVYKIVPLTREMLITLFLVTFFIIIIYVLSILYVL